MSTIDSSDYKSFPEIASGHRIGWVDTTRGFIMFSTTVCWFLPVEFRATSRFFLAHPTNSRFAQEMNYYDVGAVGYIFLMGMMMARSFAKRKLLDGSKKTIKHLLIRYFLLILIGMLVEKFAVFRQTYNPGNTPLDIIGWSVFVSLGTVGLITIPSLWLKISFKFAYAALLLIAYQLLLQIPGWREYVAMSYHGGFIGTIFGYQATMLIGVSIGELLLVRDGTERFKMIITSLFGTFFLCSGLLLANVPQLYPNKSQVTPTYVLISLGITIIGMFIFMLIVRKLKRPIPIFESFGKNTLFIFAFLMIYSVYLERIFELPRNWTVAISMILFMTILIVAMDKKKIILKL